MDTKLPPLPDSDPESLAQNKYHSFYKVGSRDYWRDADITHTIVEDFKKCQHYFVQDALEVRCQTCHMGWQAPANLQVIEGKLIFNGHETQL